MGEFGNAFRQLRLEHGLTQPELAQKLGVSRSAVSMYERGEREPDLDTLQAIAQLFEVDLNRLTGTPAVGPDDFTYALYNETKELTEDNKQKLLEMARFFKQNQKE